MRETLSFKATLDRASAERHLPELKQIGFGPAVAMVNEGDTIVASYSVNLEYAAGVAENLEAFATIIEDPDVVVDVSLSELDRGRSVFVDLLRRIDKVQEIINRRRGFWSWWTK